MIYMVNYNSKLNIFNMNKEVVRKWCFVIASHKVLSRNQLRPMAAATKHIQTLSNEQNVFLFADKEHLSNTEERN